MNVFLITFALGALLGVTTDERIVQEQSKQNEESQETRFIRGGYVQDFFNERTLSDLKSLKFHENQKISIYAAWLSCCSNQKNGKPESNLHIKKEFLSFLSGRLNAPIPKWWQDFILMENPWLNNTEKKRLEFIYEKIGGNIATAYHKQNDLKIEALGWEEIKITSQGKRIVLRHSKLETEYLKQLQDMEEKHEIFGIVAQKIDNDSHIVAISNCLYVSIFCIDKDSKVLWKKVIGSNEEEKQGFFFSGPYQAPVHLEIVATKGKVNVFCESFAALHIESLDIKNGNRLFSFNTASAEEVVLKEQQAEGQQTGTGR